MATAFLAVGSVAKGRFCFLRWVDHFAVYSVFDSGSDRGMWGGQKCLVFDVRPGAGSYMRGQVIT